MLLVLWVAAIGGCGGDGDGGGSGTCVTIVDIASSSVTAGTLESGDCTMEMLFPVSNDTSLVDQYRVTLAVPGTLTLTMDSVAFDAFLLLFSDLQQAPLAVDDDGGGGTNARIIVNLAAGTYIILANSAFPTPVMGPYTLTATFVP